MPQPGWPVLDGALVLVLEDHEDTREFYEQVLQYAGARVRAFARAIDALDACRDGLPDVALVDLSLGGPDGAWFAKGLRLLAPALPILAVTGRELFADPAHPFTAVLRKPVDALELCIEIARHLGRVS